jgi:hypothetical protein
LEERDHVRALVSVRASVNIIDLRLTKCCVLKNWNEQVWLPWVDAVEKGVEEPSEQ